MYTLATAGAKIARNAGESKRGGSNKMIMSGCGMTTLTMKDEKRLEIIQRVLRGELTLERQAWSLRAAVLPDQSAGEPTRGEGSHPW